MDFEQEYRELMSRAGEYDSDLAEIEDEHRLIGRPLLEAHMRCGGNETVRISAYPADRMLVVTYPAFIDHGEERPGLIKERLVGPNGPSLTEYFGRAVMEHENAGWTHVGGDA